MGCGSSVQDRAFAAARAGRLQNLQDALNDAGRDGTQQELLQTTDASGKSLMGIVCRGNRADCLQLLLDRGADLRQQCSGERSGTPLHEAVAGRALACVGVLMERGCDPHLENLSGFSAFELAVVCGGGRTAELMRHLEPLCSYTGWAQVKTAKSLLAGNSWKRVWLVAAKRVAAAGDRVLYELHIFQDDVHYHRLNRIGLAGATAAVGPAPEFRSTLTLAGSQVEDEALSGLHTIQDAAATTSSVFFLPDGDNAAARNALQSFCSCVNSVAPQCKGFASPAATQPPGKTAKSEAGSKAAGGGRSAGVDWESIEFEIQAEYEAELQAEKMAEDSRRHRESDQRDDSAGAPASARAGAPAGSAAGQRGRGAARRSGGGARTATGVKKKKEKERELKYTGPHEEMAKRVMADVIDSCNVKWRDIAGLKPVKDSMREALVLPLMQPHLFKGLRQPPKGVLLFGPPGTGKTLLAKAVATECGTTFFNISAGSLLSKFYGESEAMVKTLFDLAQQNAPAVIFVDEVDSLCVSRDSSKAHEATKRVTNQFLLQIDGAQDVKAQGGLVMVLAATNYPWNLDTAMLRRMEKRIFIPPPNLVQRYQMLKLLLAQEPMTPSVDLRRIAERTEGYSSSDIAQVCRKAAMGALHRALPQVGSASQTVPKEQLEPIRAPDFEAALQHVKPVFSPADVQKYTDWAAKFGST